MPVGPALALGLTVAARRRRVGAAAAPERASEEASAAFALDLGVGRLLGDGQTRLALVHGLGLQNRFGLVSAEPAAAGRLFGETGLGSPYLAFADQGDGMVLAQEVGPGRGGPAGRRPRRVRTGRSLAIGSATRSWSVSWCAASARAAC